jgi:CRP/FNR family transcriptional regulator, cyclic AMP receptor protein
MPTQAEILATVPLFALLDDQERTTLAERIDVVTYPAGATVYHLGDPGDALFIVREGQVDIWFKTDTGDRIVVETARVGDYFGEISLVDGGPRTANALVTSDLTALCVDRGDLDELFRLQPAAAMDLLAATGRRLRETTTLLRRTASHDVNEEIEDTRTLVMKAADWIAAASGSIPFLLLHCVAFFVWIALNVAPLSHAGFGGFDPYPFGLLTMVVSLEAIILSVFVLLSQNRQATRDRVRNDIEYKVNLKAELEIAHLHEKVDEMNAVFLQRLQEVEAVRASVLAKAALAIDQGRAG